jgi:isoleucyl-tRNA synthetase
MFPSISPKQSFPALESEILAYWKANKTFEKSVSSRPEDNPYRFYDGPPFITGTPHYGNLLSSIVKDVVGRYWTMRGKRVDRIWWWDCHGLPIEEKVQKKLGLASNKEIEERGVKEFIDGCYEYTASTSAEWTWYIDKIGRWVDMDRAYRTMDQDYMESVMWVFRQLWDKWLIYEGKRVSLYSWKLGTPISNFEVAMDDTYQEVNDPAVTVKFKLEKNSIFPEGTSVLAWTTTPWTIVANMALAVRKDIEYVVIENNGEKLIVAKNRLETVFKWKGDYTIVQELKGSELVGLSYIPPFPEYYNKKHGEKNHKIYHADFITDTDGTGIGHEAPEFGDVDFQLAKREWIFISEAMDEAGKYTSQIFDYEWTHYQDANKINIERMKENGTLFKHESISHRVPFCPRSGTPLVQKAQASWFIDIQSQKEKLLEANKQINWFPEHLKYGRFAKGIESAPDWCISRTRYWWAPMPVWQSKNGSERVVVSSREEIFEMNKPYGQLEKREVEWKIKYFFKWGEFDGIEFNLHKPYIDSILLAPKSAQTARKVLWVHGFRRTENVVDFFAQTTKNLEDQWIQVTCPLFEEWETVNYETWKKTFLENIDWVDTIFAHSLGCRLSLDMIIKYQIPLKKLILIAPPEGKHERLQEFLWELQEDISKINKFVEEVVILYSVDDKEWRVVASKELVEKTNGHSIRLSGFWHFNITENKLIEWLILHGAPLVRIPEVLDVWMDSGSMPYAQVHFPFAGFEDTSIKKAQTEDEKTANFASSRRCGKKSSIWTSRIDPILPMSGFVRISGKVMYIMFQSEALLLVQYRFQLR